MSEYIVDFGTSTYKSNDGLIFAPVEQLCEEIVRCGDCKYYHECWDLCERLKPGMVVDPDGFCAWGERENG